MTLQQLYYFTVISKYMHFCKAAEAIHISQPSLSQSIKNLEAELNVPLFEKNGRNVILTNYGETLLHHSKKILEDVDNLKIAISDMTKDLINEIRIGSIAPISIDYLPNIIIDFMQENDAQDYKFFCDQAMTKKLILDVANDKIDIGFGSYDQNAEELQDYAFHPVVEEEIALITPLDHPLARYETIDLKMIEDYPIITINNSSPLGKQIKKIFKDNNINVNQACEVYDENTIGALVEKGIGIAYLPETVGIKRMINNKQIKKITIRDVKESRQLYMFYKKSIFTNKAVKKFIDYIINK